LIEELISQLANIRNALGRGQRAYAEADQPYRNSPSYPAIEGFVSKRPSGYREGIKATGDATFADAVAETLRSYFALWAVERHLDLSNPAMKFLRLLPLDDEEVLAECPVYAVPKRTLCSIASRESAPAMRCFPAGQVHRPSTPASPPHRRRLG
jgi:hypothetical protein